MSRLAPTGRLTALAMAVVLVFALAGSGVGTDARLVDSEVVTVPVVVFGAAPDDESGLVGTPLTLTFEGLTGETADWPDGFTAVADDTATASFSVASTDTTGETNETTDAPPEPEYVVRVDSVGSDSVRFTLAGGEQTPATVAVDGDLLAGALGLSAFDSASVELRIDGIVTGYDTTAGGVVQFHTSDWADRTVTFRAVDSEAPVTDPITETPTAPGDEPNGTTEEPNGTTEEPNGTTEEPNGTTEAPTEGPNSTTEAPAEETPTEGPSGETPTEETPTEEAPTETPTEEAPTETPTETPTEAPTEETPTETPTETPSDETPTESTPTETPTTDAPTESTPTEKSTDSTPTETSSDETKTEAPTEPSEPTETTESESSATETTDTDSTQTPDEAGE